MILDKIQLDLKEALKNREALRAGALRFLLSEIQNRRIELRPQLGDKKLSDEEVVKILRREVKRRQESIEAYRRGGREDLVKKEEQELEILNTYLPQGMPAEELEKIIKETIDQVGASGPGDFGKVMGAVMGKVKGRTDGKRAAETVKKMLG